MAYFLIRPWYKKKAYEVPSWSTGTDAEITEALQKHYAGEINLHDYWNVGDERTVSLSAMEATGVGESHIAQTITMVLMNKGGKTLSDGTTECAFIVGQKDCLNEKGYINSTSVNAYGWDQCDRRTWCNSVYRNSLPSTLVGIFKQFRNQTGKGSVAYNTLVTSIDYFALPSEIEVQGTVYGATSGEGTQFKYYETESHRKKDIINNPSYYDHGTYYWTRSPYIKATYNSDFCAIAWNTSDMHYSATNNVGLAPFGCI